MCGIAGIATPGRSVDEAVLNDMVSAMRHRGPDGEGLWIDGDIGLGMRRLAIVDVLGGRQPLASEDGAVRVVFNGEIYNHDQLRDWVLVRGHTLASKTDGEVIAHLYEQLGERFVEHLEGIFALAIWDKRNRTLLLARDQLGVKPLYFYESTGQVRFASELKALLRNPAVPRDLDLVALDQHLSFRFTPAPRTLLRGVSKLEPATTLSLRDGRVSTRRYWDPSPLERRDLPFDEAAARLRDELAASVHRQMMSDRPIGVMLSGGMDSAAIVATMAERSGQVKTFTVGFEGGGDADETGLARETAQLFGTEHQDLIVGASEFGDSLRETITVLEEPVGTSSAIGFRAVSRLAGESVPVLLSGQGADELVGGYWRYVGEWLASLSLGTVKRFHAQRAITRFGERTKSARLERGLRAIRHPDTLDRFMNIYAVFNEAQKQQLYAPRMRNLEGSAPSCVERYRERALTRDPLGQMLYVDMRLWLPDDLLLVGDKMSMSESVEMRVPFLDHHLVEYVESLPTSYKLRRGQRKAVLKRAMRGVLPPSIIDRKERGFVTPIDRWLRDGLYEESRRLLLDSPVLGDQLFEPRYVEQLIEEHHSGRADHTRRLFSLVSLELWAQTFLGDSRR